MANVNLYHVTIFSLYLSFTVYYFYSKMRSFKPFLSISELFWTVSIRSFPILRNSQLESDVYPLP